MQLKPAKGSVDVLIFVSDLRKSLDFYQETLGLEKMEEVPTPFGNVHRLRYGNSLIKFMDPEPVPPDLRSAMVKDPDGNSSSSYSSDNTSVDATGTSPAARAAVAENPPHQEDRRGDRTLTSAQQKERPWLTSSTASGVSATGSEPARRVA